MPWGGRHRYDFVVDEGNGRFTRVQCKSGVYRRSAIYFRTCSADKRQPMGDPYVGQIDAFAVYCPELDRAYLIPIADIPARQLARPVSTRPATVKQTGSVGQHRTSYPRGPNTTTANRTDGAEDGIRTRGPVLGKDVRYRCATSA